MNSNTATEAATALNMTQPGVSKALRQIEDELGIVLFERIKGRLYATPDARTIYPEIEKVFSAVKAVKQVAGNLRDMETGSVSLAALPTMANVLLPDLICEFHQNLPNVHLSVEVLPAPRIVERVMEGDIDIGLVGDSTEVSTVKSEDLFECECVCIMAPDHPLAGRDHVALADMLAFPIISYFVDSPFGTRVRKAFEAQGLTYEAAVETNAVTTICLIVENNAGIAVIDPYVLCTDNAPRVVARAIWPRITIRPRLLYPQYRPLSTAARWFAAMFKDMTEKKVRKYARIVDS
ncbi:MAG: LysR family transcriptional regulator [Alphaproteobacteria bacterium]|nr:LysR family transcriptional regulator [Alphaproteobacteria bacterium]